jgi:hypothetical protein
MRPQWNENIWWVSYPNRVTHCMIDQWIFNVLSSILCYDNYMISPVNFIVFNVFPKFSLVLLLF